MSNNPSNEKRGPLAWMAGNTVAANLLMIIMLVGGLMYMVSIKKEVFPDFTRGIILVSVAYPGASPEEVEQGILLSIEEAVRSVDGIKEVTAVAREGGGTVNAELLRGADEQKVHQDVQQEVDRIRSLPDEAERPEVVLAGHSHGVVDLVIYGDQEESILREVAEQISDRLLESPLITKVDLDGIRPYEISVEIPQNTLREYNLTLDQVATVISRSAIELPGGGIKTQGGEILVRVKERKDWASEFATISVIENTGGTPVFLGDIAQIKDGFEDTDASATWNGMPGVGVDVYRIGDQTPIEVAAEAKRIIKEIETDLPPGVFMAIRRDRSEIYQQRMDLLLRNAYIGLALVLILLGLFLESRLAFWVTMGIPISFLGAFLFLPAAGVSINMITMFAFIISLGIVVDDAIVVGENIFEHMQKGDPFILAAVRGVREVAMPVTFSVLTNVVTFLPLMFIPGVMGKIFKNIPIVVCLVFLISLVECLFILPAHLTHGKREKGRLNKIIFGWQHAFSQWFRNMVKKIYGPFLKFILCHKYITVAFGVMILTITLGYVKSGRMGFDLMPRTESDRADVTAVLPYGVPVEKTEAVRDKLIHAAQKVVDANGGTELCRGIYASIRSSSNSVRVSVYLNPPEQRPISTKKYVDLWREKVGGLVGVRSVLFQSDRGGPGGGASITIELNHRDTTTLDRAGQELAAALGDIPVTKDIDDGTAQGKEQLDFHLTSEGRNLGFTASEVGRQVRASFYGKRALRQQRGRDELTVMVRLPESERISEYDLDRLMLRSPQGKDVPLRQIVTIERGRAYKQINRRNGKRTLTVKTNVEPAKETSKVTDELKSTVLPELANSFPGLQFSFQGRHARMAESMASLKSGFVIAMLAIFAMLAIPLRSYIQPLIIMVSIPFGIVGAVVGHLLMGYPSLSIMSMMGIVALAGVVINDALVLIDYTNRLRRQGKSSFDAISGAGVRRFRPIMLTTLTTFGGLAPMIFETSRQARFMIPMALSLGFGILFATFITLLLIPCLYLIVEDLRGISHFIFGNTGREE